MQPPSLSSDRQRATRQIHHGLDARERQPVRPECRQADGSTQRRPVSTALDSARDDGWLSPAPGRSRRLHSLDYPVCHRRRSCLSDPAPDWRPSPARWLELPTIEGVKLAVARGDAWPVSASSPSRRSSAGALSRPYGSVARRPSVGARPWDLRILRPHGVLRTVVSFAVVSLIAAMAMYREMGVAYWLEKAEAELRV